MTNGYYVESTDDGVIISRFCRQHDYLNPTGSTLSFDCKDVRDALLIADMLLNGREGRRKCPLDMIIKVSNIEFDTKWRDPEPDEDEIDG